ncbi:hypothetical protein, partial [Paraburkholderia sp. Ac-20347]|uniref:hypothetical protein n=1 Tax=Paraburkholderia sp. Ac-20347 TaxID=2703892 RepID=UPI0019825AD2
GVARDFGKSGRGHEISIYGNAFQHLPDRMRRRHHRPRIQNESGDKQPAIAPTIDFFRLPD